jgi:hypothetical protein
MRERRKKINGTVVFDYKDLLDRRKHKGKIILKMKKGPMTYTSTEGTRFFKDHPFQLVDETEAQHLLSFKEDNFVYFVNASVEDVEDYYSD